MTERYRYTIFFTNDIVIISSPIVVNEDVKFEEFEKKHLLEHLQYNISPIPKDTHFVGIGFELASENTQDAVGIFTLAKHHVDCNISSNMAGLGRETIYDREKPMIIYPSHKMQWVPVNEDMVVKQLRADRSCLQAQLGTARGLLLPFQEQRDQLEGDNQRLLEENRILKGELREVRGELKKVREYVERVKQCVEDDGDDGEDIVFANE